MLKSMLYFEQQVLVFWAAYQVATLVKRKSSKARMDLGQDSKEGLVSFLLGSTVNKSLAVCLYNVILDIYTHYT